MNASDTGSSIDGCCGTVGDKVAESLKILRARKDELTSEALRTARDAARSTGDIVLHHPYSALGVAALAGLVIGILASRR
jgi:ElaB/YqjD/DUF883 family membrane-anchored ribosome-binding protein